MLGCVDEVNSENGARICDAKHKSAGDGAGGSHIVIIITMQTLHALHTII